MEVLIPLVSLAGLYSISNQSKTSNKENFDASGKKAKNRFSSDLPNTDVPERNFPPENKFTGETDQSTLLSKVNKNSQPNRAWTDKYYDPQSNYLIQQSAQFAEKTGKQYTSLEGNNVDLTHFVHGNMVPFFGSKTHSNHQTFNSNEGILDNYMGSGSVSYAYNKQEIAPLFKPSAGNQWTNGTPNMNDFMQTRVNPSMNRNGERPSHLEPVQVAPGLGLGYTNEGALGYNSGLGLREAWIDKKVDELRVSTNPKASDGRAWGHEGPAISHITKQGILGKQQKNRPETAFETGANRWMTTTGASVAPTSRAVQLDRSTNRQTQSDFEYEGIATANHMPVINGDYLPSKRNELGQVPIGVSTAVGKGTPTESDYQTKSSYAYENNRSLNDQETYYGAIGGVIGAVVAPLLDILKPSRKENAIGNLRPYENAKPAVTNSYLYDPEDIPNHTVRETTEGGTGHLFVNRSQMMQGDGYDVAPRDIRPEQRDTTTDFYYAGGSSAGSHTLAPRRYDTEYYGSQANDAKDAIVSQTGYTPNGVMEIGYGKYGDVQTSNTKDIFLRNQRELFKTDGPAYLPSTDTMGQLQERNTPRLTVNMERSTPDLLNAYRSNPYTQFKNYENKQLPSMI
jgi:hypothetical protein